MTSNEEPLDLAAIRARVEAATEGRGSDVGDAEIIAHDVPALLDALATRDAVIAEARAASHDEWKSWSDLRGILAQSPSTALDAVKAEALEEFAATIRHKQHAESVRQMAIKRARQYRTTPTEGATP